MKKKISIPVVVGAIVLGILPVITTGCSKPESEAPPTGYPGGQKSGAVNNAPSSAGGAVGSAPTSAGH